MWAGSFLQAVGNRIYEIFIFYTPVENYFELFFFNFYKNYRKTEKSKIIL